MKIKIKKCPRCRSREIDLFSGAITSDYYCKKCGYIGPIVIEEEINK